MHKAYGITSPKNRTAVTDIIMAHTEGTKASKNIGRASMANALERSKVTRSRWCFFNIGKILAAYLTLINNFTYLFSASVPITDLISKSSLSIDNSPTVNPLINPAKKVRTINVNLK